ncbi:MAG: bifunctional DNA-binding transcriptional regulator/O6-methylguanine-DNA methyltransferase Ada [Alphaproteobacteria bacterium]|nr:bifunctional DNA-binding transcriptional regulator/O6-methylguanine-DNA methyltransferase Ada [Alphaproteobacteria bacterium]
MTARLDDRWTALARRDRAADGTFVYAVRTTGVYCRPSCASRRPRPENVRFFGTAEAARTAGFRPCKRCRPDQTAVNGAAEAVAKACRLIREAEEEPDLAALARAVGLSPAHFQKLFKAELGLSPKRYAMALRKGNWRQALAVAPSVTEAIYDAGFGASSRAYAASDALGMAPSRYRAGAEGEVIRHAAAKTSLGPILVAATAKGVCMVEFGETAAAEALLRSRFPKAEFRAADSHLGALVAEVVARIDRPGQGGALPLDIRGTAFQERVWRALGEIPLGGTVSYADLAADIGRPDAVRAVAGAVAANRLAVVVPCHRVLRNTGAISGYRWGVTRKRALLDRESAAAKRIAS